MEGPFGSLAASVGEWVHNRGLIVTLPMLNASLEHVARLRSHRRRASLSEQRIPYTTLREPVGLTDIGAFVTPFTTVSTAL
jgi:hypothetical protein